MSSSSFAGVTAVAVASAILLGAMAACGGGDTRAADSTRPARSTRVVAAASQATPAPAPMTDANVLAALDEADKADSATGALAASKGTNTEVRAFGREMMKDHHAMRRAGEDLAKQLSLTPVAAAADAAPALDAAAADSLAAAPAGAAWDKRYIDLAVTHHTAVLVTAQSAMASAQHPELKAMIEKAAPIVQQHLDHARSIQSKLP